ncbi:MAG: endonuclease III domain-containing protein [Planctomycetota bacterium]|jgi:endonuclease-3 related protein
MLQENLTEIYELLFARFGGQDWWPGETPFEIMVGAILTQNTNWGNVEKAIGNLKSGNLLDPEGLDNIEVSELADHIRAAGYFNVKAKRLKNFVDWLFANYGGELKELETVGTEQLRAELLGVRGIGRETADSILLYALNREVFVVDTYTARVTVRHGLIEAEADYEQLRELFESNLPCDVRLYNEYHALLVRVGKEFCRPKPRCGGCPLERLPHTVDE